MEKFIYFSNSTQIVKFCIKKIKCTQNEVIEVFGSFNCDDFGSHLTKTHQFTISTNFIVGLLESMFIYCI